MSPKTVYAIASGKGGVGKTTTAVNLGTALAAAGREVAVVDADLGMANLASFVGLDAEGATLHDALAGTASVADATYRAGDDLAVVPGGTDLAEYAAADAADLGGVVEALRAEFEHVLLDAGAGVSHETVLPTGLADAVLVVATPEPAALQDASKTVDLTERAGGTVEGLVVTRSRPDGDVPGEALAARLDVPLVGSIPEDDAVRESLVAGTPLVVHAPESPASGAYRRLARRILGDSAPDEANGDGEATEADATNAVGPTDAAGATDAADATNDEDDAGDAAEAVAVPATDGQDAGDDSAKDARDAVETGDGGDAARPDGERSEETDDGSDETDGDGTDGVGTGDEEGDDEETTTATEGITIPDPEADDRDDESRDGDDGDDGGVTVEEEPDDAADDAVPEAVPFQGETGESDADSTDGDDGEGEGDDDGGGLFGRLFG